MSDYGTMISRCLSDMNRTDLTATVQSEIISAIDHYERSDWYFLETQTDITSTASTEYYNLPADFVKLDSLVITVNGNTYPLNRRTYGYLEDIFVRSTTYTGQPTDYAIYQEQIRLYPVPVAAYVMTLSYVQTLAGLTTSTDSNAWTTTGEELIRSRVCSQVAARKLHDLDKAQTYRALEADALSDLRGLNMRRLMTGHSRRRFQ
jgi:hypothetical protein